MSVRVQRIFKIWEEREIYSAEFISKLNLLLQPSPSQIINVEVESKPAAKLQSDFEVDIYFCCTEVWNFVSYIFVLLLKANTLVEKIRQCKCLEEETDMKQQILNESKVPTLTLEYWSNIYLPSTVLYFLMNDRLKLLK